MSYNNFIFAAGASNNATLTTPLRETLAGISSSTSLACWIVLLLPQLIEQWKLKSSEGLSVGFILIWFIGDIANLSGALWAGLLPGVILLAVWFCIADGMLISSYLYYSKKPAHKHHHHHHHHHHDAIAAAEEGRVETSNENQPLLADSTTGLATSGAKRKSSSRRKSQRRDSLASLVAPESVNIWTSYVLPLAFVLLAGFAGFLFSSNNASNSPEQPPAADEPMKTGPEILGYLSAALYLGARLPQIYQNHKKRSVHGLSLLFFLFSVFGNVTYAGGILLYRNDAEYIWHYLPWLLGSLGTVFEDMIIFLQFYIYRQQNSQQGSAIIE
ncbi:hypothetical protein D0Z00_002603 [Geotrichum galactomycetum]|uniref:Uncharacterized protein n=1 Tax=Geotrichum galactomycetum TaxID=27317 RepID=A0ACB6V3M0_9ASCO|nr:hypothetical protein D0Z00_002603 [Geotrichum candidum]